jgi:hypothetical protein
MRFHDREGFTTPWSMKVFAIMEILFGTAQWGGGPVAARGRPSQRAGQGRPVPSGDVVVGSVGKTHGRLARSHPARVATGVNHGG